MEIDQRILAELQNIKEVIANIIAQKNEEKDRIKRMELGLIAMKLFNSVKFLDEMLTRYILEKDENGEYKHATLGPNYFNRTLGEITRTET